MTPPAAPRADQARTRAARAAVVEAARALFVAQGYGATTIEAISTASAVPPATVYRLFSSKQGVLKALLDSALAGDDEPVAIAARPHVRALLEAPDAADRVRGFVAMSVQMNRRAAPIIAILLGAAGSEPDAAALLDELTGQRQRGQALIARSLARSGALRPGLRPRDAADVIHALLSPELYRLLVVDRRWSLGRYERWLAGLLIDELLGADR